MASYQREVIKNFGHKRRKTLVNRRCVICGKHIKVTVFEDGRYRGGEYFGNMPELAIRKHRDYGDAAITEEIWRHASEYWECPACARK